MLAGFTSRKIEVGATYLHVTEAGDGPSILLLHGFPETHLMWRDIAPVLARHFRVICPDLPGYGQSGYPMSPEDDFPSSKRDIAALMIEMMRELGHARFMAAGHDRGGRVAYRLALDHPGSVEKLALLDIVPTGLAWDRADARLALSFWPWSLLAQPFPLPEVLISARPDAVIDHVSAQWGSAKVFPPEIARAYAEPLHDFERVHAICEEYRAAATVDREHDAADLNSRLKIRCPVLALWSAEGGLNQWYAGEGGPLALWRLFCDHVDGRAVPGGHFFPEEFPEETSASLMSFFGK